MRGHPTRVVQITDLHVGAAGEMPRGVDVRRNFERVLSAVAEEGPDHVVVSGDLCDHEGDRAAYAYIRRGLESLTIPFSVIAGNHDISRNLAESFDLTSELHGSVEPELYYRKSIGGTDFLFLDTARATVSDEQLTWVRSEVATRRARVPLLVMHHPPFESACRYMDAHYPFRRTAELLRALLAGAAERDGIDSRGIAAGGEAVGGEAAADGAGEAATIPPVDAIFCGHYHAEAEVTRGPFRAFITPSLWFQICRTSEEMVIESRRVGYRTITLEEHGLKTSVRYLKET